MKGWLYSRILKMRNRHMFALDVLVLSLTPLFSIILRLERLQGVVSYAAPLVAYTVMSIPLKIGVFWTARFYNRYWRYASVDDFASLCLGTVTAWLLCVLGFFLVLTPLAIVPEGFPRSVPFIDGFLTLVFIGGLRFAFRMAYVMKERSKLGSAKKNALIVGAGISGSIIVKELRDNPQSGLKAVCFVDDNPAKQGAMIQGVKVVGTLSVLPQLLAGGKIDEVIIAMPTAPGKTIRGVIQACKDAQVVSKTIPSLFEILSGSAIAQLRELKIEDLLRRGIIEIDKSDVAQLISGGRVLVTGAGGSIGSELCRQIISFRPKELVLLGHGENSIFQLAAELRSRHGLISESVAIHTVIADIRDRDRIDHVFEFYRPEIVFHAAAHKHVGLMEKNVFDAVTNNVQGTQILVDLADRHHVKKFVMISSDKAVNPTSVMGVTKRIAELVVCHAADRTGRNFVAVRFGNVLGSRGSVIPIFRQQIEEGGPIKVTHPDATRFFMTIPEAVQLVLQAGTMGTGGEIFVLDMGEPIKIVELARDLLRLSGLQEGRDIDIVFTGLSKGEKMHEEIFYQEEKTERSRNEKIFICKDNFEDSPMLLRMNNVMRSVQMLIAAAHAGDLELVSRCLTTIVPQYHDHEIADATNQRQERKQGVVIPMEKLVSDSSARPASVGNRYKPL